MDVSALTSTIVTLFSGYLGTGAREVIAKVGEQAFEETKARARQILSLLLGRLEGSPAADQLREIEQGALDPTSANGLEEAIEEALSDDDGLRREVSETLQNAGVKIIDMKAKAAGGGIVIQVEGGVGRDVNFGRPRG